MRVSLAIIMSAIVAFCWFYPPLHIGLLILSSNYVLARKCEIFDCGAYQYKVCGEEIYCRDYLCENTCLDENIKKFRGKGGVKGVGYGLKYFHEENRCDCEIKWGKCHDEEHVLEWIKNHDSPCRNN